MNARPVTHVGIERPDVRKSEELFMYRVNAKPMPTTKATYMSRMA
jgi:hypothetical protein